MIWWQPCATASTRPALRLFRPCSSVRLQAASRPKPLKLPHSQQYAEGKPHRAPTHSRDGAKRPTWKPEHGALSTTWNAMICSTPAGMVQAMRNAHCSKEYRAARNHSTVTLLARFRGLSTSVPRAQAVW